MPDACRCTNETGEEKMSEKEAAELLSLPVKSIEDQINQTAEDAVN